MTGEEHLEEAAVAVKKYMDKSECGFCQRKAENINRAIIGLRDLTAEAQELAAKIKASKELAAMGNPTAVKPNTQISRARERVASMRTSPVLPAPKATYYPPTRTETAKAIVKPAKITATDTIGLGLRDLVRTRPKLKDIIYTGD